MKMKFVMFYYFVAWHCISFGISFDFKSPNIEIYLPFGFIRIGWNISTGTKPINYLQCQGRTFGIDERY